MTEPQGIIGHIATAEARLVSARMADDHEAEMYYLNASIAESLLAIARILNEVTRTGRALDVNTVDR